MSVLMYDSIDATAIPPDAAVVAGYGDGAFVWSPSWKDGSNWFDLFPNAVHLVIVVNAGDQGDVLDVQEGAAAPGDVPGWVSRFDRPGRRRPTIYSSRSMWPVILAALQAAGMSAADVDWWAATLDGTRDVPGSVAVQYLDAGPYDVSEVHDLSWVGLAPPPTMPRPTPIQEVMPMTQELPLPDGTLATFELLPEAAIWYTQTDPNNFNVLASTRLPGDYLSIERVGLFQGELFVRGRGVDHATGHTDGKLYQTTLQLQSGAAWSPPVAIA